jgi:hypothetical protein
VKGNGVQESNFRRGQGALDFILAFVAVLWLIIGITRVWTWFHFNYANLQVNYQKTRLGAGNATFYNDNDPQPVATGYQPLDLTQNWVFKGEPSGTVRK